MIRFSFLRGEYGVGLNFTIGFNATTDIVTGVHTSRRQLEKALWTPEAKSGPFTVLHLQSPPSMGQVCTNR